MIIEPGDKVVKMTAAEAWQCGLQFAHEAATKIRGNLTRPEQVSAQESQVRLLTDLAQAFAALAAAVPVSDHQAGDWLAVQGLERPPRLGMLLPWEHDLRVTMWTSEGKSLFEHGDGIYSYEVDEQDEAGFTARQKITLKPTPERLAQGKKPDGHRIDGTPFWHLGEPTNPGVLIDVEALRQAMQEANDPEVTEPELESP